jgi:hypothetical protein
VRVRQLIQYGRRTRKLNLSSVDSLDYAQYIADYELSQHKDPRGTVTSFTLRSHGTNGDTLLHTQQLALTWGDTVQLAETQLGVNGRYRIIGERHCLSDSATHWETVFFVEPAPTEFPWKLGVGGRSELATTGVPPQGAPVPSTRLAF